jgi:carbonic anhydrase
MFSKRLMLLSVAGLVAMPVGASESAHHWSYAGAEGPAHWGATCGTGKAQSPIDIHPAAAKSEMLPALAFNYRPGPLEIIDNGHSVQVNVAKGSTLVVGGVRFSLVQFHFHKPSEEAIDGRHFAMVAHIVHRDPQGHLAVVAVPLTAGAANPLIATLWRHLPKEKGRDVSPAGVTIDPSQLLPANHGYFTYVGSLTTPPCTEGVRWFVLRSPMTVSPEEITAFAKLYPANARPIQATNKREVLTSR